MCGTPTSEKLCNRDMGATRSEMHKYVWDLGIPHEVLAHMVLVTKVGVLVTCTDDETIYCAGYGYPLMVCD